MVWKSRLAWGLGWLSLAILFLDGVSRPDVWAGQFTDANRAGQPVSPTFPLPEGARIDGKVSLDHGRLVARETCCVRIPVASGDADLVIRGCLGSLGKELRIRMVEPGGARAVVPITARDHTFAMGRKGPWGGVENAQNVTLPDACLVLLEGFQYFIRPNPFYYDLVDQQRMAQPGGALPAASRHVFEVLLQYQKRQVQCWIDGRYLATFPHRINQHLQPEQRTFLQGLAEVAVDLPEGSSLRSVEFRPCEANGNYLPVALGRYARPGVMRSGKLSLSEGRQTLHGVPLRVVAPADSIDVGVSRDVLGRGAMLDDLYYERSAFDGVPQSIIFSVPRKQYLCAHLLCAVEEDSRKVPVLTARLTRYCREGRGDALADTVVTLPRRGEPLPDGVRLAGTLTLRTRGKMVPMPLYQVAIPLKVGQIQDLLVDDVRGMHGNGDYFDFELTRGMEKGPTEWGLFPPGAGGTGTAYKPSGPPSAVHVFALTLEESPVTFVCRTRRAGNVFYRAENPVFLVSLTNRSGRAGQYRVAWEYTDVDGGKTAGARTIDLPAAPEERIVEVPADPGEVGWYGVSLRLLDAAGRLLVDHRAAVAILPPDTRRAGYESPYGTWWFMGSHGGTPDPRIAGPLFLRAGLRHTTVNARSGVSEKELGPYKVTAAYLPYLYRRYEQPLEQWMAESRKIIEETLEKFPHCDSALIFHEDGGGHPHLPHGCLPFPPELLSTGAVPKDALPRFTPPQEKAFHEYLWDKAAALSRFYREKHPQIKLAFGNSGWSGPLVAEFFRRKYPKQYIDCLGSEVLGQTFIPEKLDIGTTLGASLLLKETARKLGYGRIPLTACYEWIGRPVPRLGPRVQGEWYARDCLLAHVFGFHRINPALLYDVSNCYYHSPWGATGLLTRYPALVPRPSYVALATLTEVLDCAKAVRSLATGSRSLYAIEFETSHGRTYALWTPRGVREATLQFAQDTEFTRIDLWGRRKRVKTKGAAADLAVSTAPAFLRSPVAIRAVSAGESRFPADRVPDGLHEVCRMDRPEQWTLTGQPDPRLECPRRDYPPFMTQGKMELSLADDAQRGKCLELKLVPERPLPDIVGEYALLRLKQPIPVERVPRTVGLWVRGNSSWGRVMWELVDAKGTHWLSCGRGGWGCDMLDWEGRVSINFDGWNFLQMSLPRHPEQGPEGWMFPQWLNSGGDLHLNPPLRLSGVAVLLYRKAPCLDQLEPVENLSVRLQGLSVLPE